MYLRRFCKQMNYDKSSPIQLINPVNNAMLPGTACSLNSERSSYKQISNLHVHDFLIRTHHAIAHFRGGTK